MEKLVCGECGIGFDRPGARGPIPTRCPDCKTQRRRVKSTDHERARQARLAAGQYRCGHCHKIKTGDEFAPSQRKDGMWCRQCFRESYVDRSGGLVTRTCATCDSTFDVVATSRRKYCSRSCKDRAFQIMETARLRESKAGRPCQNCGNEIPPERMSNARYCTEACRKAHVGPGIRRRSMLKRLYGLTLEQYAGLLATQGDCCAICRETDPGTKGVWHVDHCHTSTAVRGLLCSACNTGLGHFKDRPEVLRRAADYLEKSD